MVPHGLARLGRGVDAQARAHGVGGDRRALGARQVVAEDGLQNLAVAQLLALVVAGRGGVESAAPRRRPHRAEEGEQRDVDQNRVLGALPAVQRHVQALEGEELAHPTELWALEVERVVGRVRAATAARAPVVRRLPLERQLDDHRRARVVVAPDRRLEVLLLAQRVARRLLVAHAVAAPALQHERRRGHEGRWRLARDGARLDDVALVVFLADDDLLFATNHKVAALLVRTLADLAEEGVRLVAQHAKVRVEHQRQLREPDALLPRDVGRERRGEPLGDIPSGVGGVGVAALGGGDGLLDDVRPVGGGGGGSTGAGTHVLPRCAPLRRALDLRRPRRQRGIAAAATALERRVDRRVVPVPRVHRAAYVGVARLGVVRVVEDAVLDHDHVDRDVQLVVEVAQPGLVGRHPPAGRVGLLRVLEDLVAHLDPLRAVVRVAEVGAVAAHRVDVQRVHPDEEVGAGGGVHLRVVLRPGGLVDRIRPGKVAPAKDLAVLPAVEVL